MTQYLIKPRRGVDAAPELVEITDNDAVTRPATREAATRLRMTLFACTFPQIRPPPKWRPNRMATFKPPATPIATLVPTEIQGGVMTAVWRFRRTGAPPSQAWPCGMDRGQQSTVAAGKGG